VSELDPFPWNGYDTFLLLGQLVGGVPTPMRWICESRRFFIVVGGGHSRCLT
jgi:hypothetical protein